MKVAILGAGVAGVSTAIALKQKGFDVSVYERQDSPATMGAGIVAWPNAAYVLEQLGVLDDIAAVFGRPTEMRRVSKSGEQLGAIDITAINRHMGYPSLSVLRQDFQAALIARLASLGVDIHYQHAVAGIETRSGRAEVHFEGGMTASADIVIGADGRMASHARSYVLGDNTPVYQGFINWVGVYESNDACFDEIAVTDYWGVGERFGIVPINRHRAYWAGGVACAGVGARNPAAYREELLAIFADWPDPVPRMITDTPIARMNKIYVHDHDPIRAWHKHNLLVIGDAAHAPLPTSGQGACQALEDAWHLANCLEASPGNLEAAFARFTALRLAKTSGIIAAARTFAASLFSRDEAYCRTRDENSKRTDFSQAAAGMARFWGQHLPLQAPRPAAGSPSS